MQKRYGHFSGLLGATAFALDCIPVIVANACTLIRVDGKTSLGDRGTLGHDRSAVSTLSNDILEHE